MGLALPKARTWLFLVLLFFVVLGKAVMVIPGIVAAKFQEKAKSLGATAEIGESTLSSEGVVLHNIRIQSADFPGDVYLIEQLIISPTFQIHIKGVRGSMSGSLKEKLDRFEVWRTHHTGGSGKSSSKEIIIENMGIEWDGFVTSEDRLKISGIYFQRGKETLVKINRLNAVLNNHHIEIGGIQKNGDSKNIHVEYVEALSSDSSTKPIDKTTKDFDPIENITKWIHQLHGYTFQINSGKLYLAKKDTGLIQVEGENILFDSQWPKPKLVIQKGHIIDGDSAVKWEGLNIDSDLSDPDKTNIETKTEKLSVKYEPIAQEEIVSSKISTTISLSKNHTEASLHSGNAQFNIDTTKVSDSRKISLSIPSVECQDLIDAIPRNLIPKVSGIKTHGTFSAELEIMLGDKPVVHLGLQNHCKIDPASIPYELDVRSLKKPFKHMIYDYQGHISFMDTGPGTKNWIPFDRMSPFLECAVRTTEDPGFRESNGFSRVALENSIRDDIVAGRFFRGASTVSMQLAKNLWLSREKTLSRKIQEAILTTYLEQNLTKDEILEYYFNIIEFGPNVYGIGPAAKFYFNTDPSALRLSQALYLVSLLPNPKYQNTDSNGRVTDRYMKYLHSLMSLMKERKTINEQDYKIGLTEWIVIGQTIPDHRMPDQPDSELPDGLRMEDWQ